MNYLLIERQLMMTQQILDIYSDDIMALSLELVEDNGETKVVLSDEVTKWSITIDMEHLEKTLENLKQSYYALKALNSLGFELAMNNFVTIWSFKKYYKDCFVNVIVNTGNQPENMLVSVFVHKPISDTTELDGDKAEQFLSSLTTAQKVTYDYDKYSLAVHLLSSCIIKDSADNFAENIDNLSVQLADFIVEV
jgi:hypothetical protein